MMNKTNEKLSEVFDLEPIVPENTVQDLVPINNSVATDDADYARSNIKNLINSGSSALNNLLVVAKDSQQPRAYEFAATLIKNLSDLNKDLMDLRKKKNSLIDNIPSTPTGINVNQAVFVGSTAELIKAIKRAE